MIRINGLEKLTSKEYEKVNIENIQLILRICKDLKELETLGDTVNISNIDDTSTTFDLDNGKILRRFDARSSKEGLLSIYISEGRHVRVHDYDVKKKKFVDDYDLYVAKNIYMKEEVNEYSYEYVIRDSERDIIIKIYISATEFDRNIIIDYLLNKNYTIEGLADILPKDWLYISFDNDEEVQEIEFYNGTNVTERRGDSDGKKGKQER